MKFSQKKFLINTVTIFPQAFKELLDISIIGNARKKGIWDLGITDIPKNIGEIKDNYSKYEDYVRKYIADNDLELETPILKQGQALIWAANTFHGAGKIKNNEITRYSQVTHYHFEDLDFCYNPNFSSREKYVLRDVEASRIK